MWVPPADPTIPGSRGSRVRDDGFGYGVPERGVSPRRCRTLHDGGVLVVRGLTAVPGLPEVSFEVALGEMLRVSGPSRSGKTRLPRGSPTWIRAAARSPGREGRRPRCPRPSCSPEVVLLHEPAANLGRRHRELVVERVDRATGASAGFRRPASPTTPKKRRRGRPASSRSPKARCGSFQPARGVIRPRPAPCSPRGGCGTRHREPARDGPLPDTDHPADRRRRFGALAAVRVAARRLFDDRHRLRRYRLSRVAGGFGKGWDRSCRGERRDSRPG